MILTSGDRHDATRLLPLLEAVAPIRGRVGRPLHRPRLLYADRGHDHDTDLRSLHQRRTAPVIARRDAAHGCGPGRLPAAAFTEPARAI